MNDTEKFQQQYNLGHFIIMLHLFRLFYVEIVIILRTPSVCVEISLVYSGDLKLEKYFVQTHLVYHPNRIVKGINVKKSPKCNNYQQLD